MERREAVGICSKETVRDQQSIRMQIASYLKTSLIEWPGKIASVIFTPGCNFRCPFCHNASLVNQTERLTLIDEKQIFADLKKRKKWVDAVVVTGGEPSLQKDLPKFLKKIKKLGFLGMIHTNGTNPEVIARLLSCYLIDYVAMDIKGDFENYSNYTNCPNDQIIKNVKESMRLIIESEVEYEFRTTVVPGLHDLPSLKKLAEQIALILNTKSLILNTKWYLQQFQPKNNLDKKFLKIKPYSKEEMENFQRHLQKVIPGVFLRGV